MNKHGLAYLLNMLSISPTKMAQYLNVDRTLVSKWKNGSRKADINNPYFPKIIDYVVCRNSELGLLNLESLFVNLYKIQYIDSPDQLKLLTKQFIINNDNLNNLMEQKKTSDSCYSIAVDVYSGSEGRFNCVLDLLDYAEKQTTPTNISFVYTGVLNMYMSHIPFRSILLDKLPRLLDRGHTLEIIFSKYSNSKYISTLGPVVLHPNCRVLYYPLLGNHQANIAIHAVDNKLLSHSIFNSNNLESCHYSAMYKDPASISAYLTILNSIKSNSKPVFNIIDSKSIVDTTLGEKIYSGSKQLFNDYTISYSHSPIPIIFSIDDDFYAELLRNSISDENEINTYIQLFKEQKTLFLNYLEGNKLTMFYPINLWTNVLEDSSITYNQQLLINFPGLTLTIDQFKKHLKYLGKFLLEHENLNICLVATEHCLNKQTIYFWGRRDQLSCYVNKSISDNILFCEDISFVNALCDSLEEYYSLYPTKYTSKESVANILSSL
ncbi:MAG: hypothetical protein RR840_03710 [Clostridium sp.]